MNVKIIRGDIGKEPSDALITCVNSGGLWFGGIDRVIQRLAGNALHAQINVHQPATITQGDFGTPFKRVVFVIDDLDKPIERVLTTGLELADENGCNAVTLPAIRMGVMAGVRESRQQAIAAICTTLYQFKAKNIRDATIVLYDIDPQEFQEYLYKEQHDA